MAGPRLVSRPSASASPGRNRRQQTDDAMSKTERSTYLNHPFPRPKKAPVADLSEPPAPSKSVASTLGSKLLGRPANRVAANRGSASVSESSISRSTGGSSTLAQLSRLTPARGGSNQVASTASLRSQGTDATQLVDDSADALEAVLSISDSGGNNSVSNGGGAASSHSLVSLPTIGELPRLHGGGAGASNTANIVSSSVLSSSGASSSFQQRLYSSARAAPVLPGTDAGVKKSSPKGLVGLQNLGNTCFMNSCLQCVSNLPPVAKYFLSGSHTREINAESPTRGALATAFGELLRELWTGAQFSSTRPAELKRVIGKVAARFIGYDQQDAQEFLRFLLDGLHEDLNQVRHKPPYYEIKDREGAKDRDVSDEYWKFYLERNASALSALFCGQLRSEIRCSTCGHRSLCFDVFWDLSLPVPKKKSAHMLRMPGSFFSSASSASAASSSSSRASDGDGGLGAGCSLHDCLKAYTEQEVLPEADAYYCSRCKAHRAVSKKISVYRLPEVLVVHLKRFSFSTFSRDKVSTAVAFPALGLDVAEYCAPDAVVDGSTLYDLTGVVHHMGSLHGGHYTAECLNSDTLEWFDFNDASVSPVKKPELSSASAYVLFFRRRQEQSLTI